MKRADRQRGFALLVVLWTLGFLSLLGTALVAAGRQETQRSRNLLDSALAEARADGAVQQAIYALLDPSPARWRPDGSRHVLRSGHYRIEVRLDDENGKINPNFAPVEMLQALLAQLGVPNQDATKLAAAIDRWRTPGGQTVQVASTQPLALPSGAPFETLDELGLLPIIRRRGSWGRRPVARHAAGPAGRAEAAYVAVLELRSGCDDARSGGCRRDRAAGSQHADTDRRCAGPGGHGACRGAWPGWHRLQRGCGGADQCA